MAQKDMETVAPDDDEIENQEQDSSLPPLIPGADDIQVEIADDIPEEEEQEPDKQVAAEDEDEDEAPPADDDLIDEPDDEEYQSYSSKVKKRIFREIRRAAKAQKAATQLLRERDQVIPVVQRLVVEKQQTDNNYQQLQEAYLNLLDTSMEQMIQNKQRELKAAKDDDDGEAEIRIGSELQELVFNRRQAQELKTNFARNKSARPAVPQQPQQQQPQQRQPNPLALKWAEKNKAWYGRNKFSAETGAVLAIDEQMSQEGWDQNDPEYYREMDRRMDRKFPTLRKKPAGSNAPHKRSPVAPVNAGRAAATTVNGKKVVKLTRADLAFMERLGLDPNSKEHRIEFARQRLA